MLKWFRNRYHIIYILLALVSVLIVHRLFSLQIVDGENYRQISDSRLSRNMPIKAPRGEILDRYGRPLVTNRLGMSVAIQKVDDDKQKLNQTLLNLLHLLEENETPYQDELPVTLEEPYAFTIEGESEEAVQAKLAEWKKARNFKDATDAAGVVATFQRKYQFDEAYSQADVRKLAGVYCDMEKRNFSSSSPFVMATNLNMEIISKIKEMHEEYPCAQVYTEPIREYVNGNTAAHILGRVGIINADEYASLKNAGYGMTDSLGKLGAEKAFESYLKGTDGVNSIERTVANGENKLIYSKDPIPGNSVLLTLDLDLQKKAEQSLEENIRRLGGSGGSVSVGSVAVVDVNSGEILALASYPGYDPARYNEDFKQLSADPGNPLFNRALMGQYEPGSTYKILTAIAGLESGNLRPNETIQTKGLYRYLNHDFTCLAYRNGRGNHGTINVSKAIEVSCNYFFYEVGKRTEIETIDSYARQFGLGEYTGIELKGEESKGMLAGPESREKNGGVWYPGDTLQAAIGQSDNLFTPLQLANYIATLANGGTHYEAHLLKSVKSNTQHKMVEEKIPVVTNKVEMQPANRDAVVKGMQDVSSSGTAAATFVNYPIKVAAKTGTAEVGRGNDNAVFVAFAPYDNPQIAVSVVVEHGSHGSSVAGIARDIFDEYFLRRQAVTQQTTPEQVLLP